MTHPLFKDTLTSTSESAVTDVASNRLPYHPPFLAALAVNSHTTSSGIKTPDGQGENNGANYLFQSPS